jgi:hypothetical protein
MQKLEESHQSRFIELLKKAVPPNISLADEISYLLDVSADSAYRRLRCETGLTLDETVILCQHFDIPLDALTNGTSNSISFRIHQLGGNFEGFVGYLEALLEDMNWQSKFENRSISYAAEDMPVFYSFFFSNLARFKLGYWNKSILNVEEMQGMKVEDVQVPEAWKKISESIVANYLNTDSIEIWNEDTLKSTLHQIRYYWEAGIFRNKETALDVVKDLHDIVNLIQQQCETGKKFNFVKGSFTPAKFTLYSSDLMIGNNCVLLKANEKEASYIGYNTFNYMRTSNAYFNEQEKKWFRNLMAKSTLISEVAEKQRNKFIKELHSQVSSLESFITDN